jgi:hypothetical protein
MVRVCIERVKIGNPSKSVLMVGLRGVGKTVLLEQMRIDAETSGAHTLRAEAPEGRSLPSLLAPQLRTVLIRISRNDRAKTLATRALRGLVGFAKALKVKYGDIEVALDLESEPGLADNGDLETDLASLLEEIGKAARAAASALVIFIDELQYVEEPQLAALISALHRCTQLKLPLCLVGAGLPQLRGRAGDAKSYAERLFDYPTIGPLSNDDARTALVKPAQAAGADFTKGAVEKVISSTRGYPYFLQEWGKHAWHVAQGDAITEADVEQASIEAIAALDERFFRVRFDRLTPLQKRYLRAMAELGPGPHRSGDIADTLDRKVTALAPVRSELIGKGMIWSPSHGDTAFTVPLFDEFMRRIIPDRNWRKG